MGRNILVDSGWVVPCPPQHCHPPNPPPLRQQTRQHDDLTPAGLLYAMAWCPPLTNRKSQIWVTILWSERTMLTILTFVYIYFYFRHLDVCMHAYICTVCAGPLEATEDTELEMEMLWANMWVLRTSPGSSTRAARLLTPEPSLQTPYSFNFLKWFCKNLFMGRISLWEIP